MALPLGGLSNNGAVLRNPILDALQPKSTTSSVPNMSVKPFYPTPTGQPVQQGNLQGMINIPKTSTPSTAVKSQTVTHPSGTTIQTSYHAPDTKSPDDSSYKYNTATGQLNPNYKDPNATAPAPQPTTPSYTVGGQIPGVLATGQQTPQEQQTFQGLIGQSQAPSQAYLDAQAEAKRISDLQTALAQDYAQKDKNIQGTAGFLTQATGLEGLLNRQYGIGQQALAEQYNAATNRLNAANTQQGLQVQAGTAANTAAQNQANRATGVAENVLGAVAPQFPSYSSQIVQPGLLGANGTTGNANLDNAISNVTNLLQSGKIGYSDAQAQLSGYGQKGLDALSQWANNNNFNIAQSNTLAGQQGSVGVNYQLADNALKNVENLINQLGGLQKTNIPAVNKAANWISTQFGIGSEQTRAVTGAVQSLRNAYASLLASSKGGTPTDYSGQAQAEIPNEPTPNDIAAIRKNFETLGQARKEILGNPGQAGGTSTSGSSLYNF